MYFTSKDGVKTVAGTSSAIHSWFVWWPNVIK